MLETTLVKGCGSWAGLPPHSSRRHFPVPGLRSGPSGLLGRAGWGCAFAFIAASCRMFCEAAHFLQHKVAINAVVAHQLVRRTILDDLSGSQNDDAIEVVNGR